MSPHRNSVCVSNTSYSKIRGPPFLYDTLTRLLPWEKATVTLQIDYCHRTYNLAYLSSDCSLPAKKTTVDTDG